MKKILFILFMTLIACTPDNSNAPKLENYFSLSTDYYQVIQRFWNSEINSIVANSKEGAIMVISFSEKPDSNKRYYTQVPGVPLAEDECSFLVLLGNKVYSSQLQQRDEIYFESIIDVTLSGDYAKIEAANINMEADGTQYVLNTNFNVKLQ